MLPRRHVLLNFIDVPLCCPSNTTCIESPKQCCPEERFCLLLDGELACCFLGTQCADQFCCAEEQVYNDAGGKHCCLPGRTICGSPGSETCCPPDQPCVAGKCQKPSSCTPELCPGCCQADSCLPGNSNAACGVNGAPCVACPADQPCVGGACQGRRCSSTGCPNGCCQGDACQPGTSAFACGAGGAACVACAVGQQCVNGACSGCPLGQVACGGGGCGPGEVCVAGRCQPSPCGPSSCPNGCCLTQPNGSVQCVPQLDDPTRNVFACGKGGAACVQCNPDTGFGVADRCVDGQCRCGPQPACSVGNSCQSLGLSAGLIGSHCCPMVMANGGQTTSVCGGPTEQDLFCCPAGTSCCPCTPNGSKSVCKPLSVLRSCDDFCKTV